MAAPPALYCAQVNLLKNDGRPPFPACSVAGKQTNTAQTKTSANSPRDELWEQESSDEEDGRTSSADDEKQSARRQEARQAWDALVAQAYDDEFSICPVTFQEEHEKAEELEDNEQLLQQQQQEEWYSQQIKAESEKLLEPHQESKTRFELVVCEGCHRCHGFEPDTSGSKCLECGCDVIHHIAPEDQQEQMADSDDDEDDYQND